MADARAIAEDIRRLLQAKWQPVSIGWRVPSHRFGLSSLSIADILGFEKALAIQNQIEDLAKDDPELRAIHCPYLAPLQPRVIPASSSPPQSPKRRKPRKPRSQPKCKPTPQPSDEYDAMGSWKTEGSGWRRNGLLILGMRSDARRVTHKPILEDESPWAQIALRDWEDAEV